MLLDEVPSTHHQDYVVSTQATRPLLLNKIAFSGAEFTDSYYQTLTSPLINEAGEVSPIPLSQLNEKLEKIKDTLLYTGLFKNVSVQLDLAKELTAPITKGESNLKSSILPVNAQIKLEQLPLFKFSSITKTSDSIASVGFRYLEPNLLNQASSLLVDINVNYDPFNKLITSKVWDLTLLKPLEKYPRTRAIFNPVIAAVDAASWASHEQYSAGALFGLQSTKSHNSKNTGAATSIFTTGISFVNRQVRNVSNTASDSIRAAAGSDFKLGAIFNFKYDSRETIGGLATNGILVDFTNELAGYNSADIFADNNNNTPLKSFNKSIFKFQSFKSILNNSLTSELNFETGLIFQRSNNSVPLVDKFTLGGINSLRGFQLNSVGLKDGEDFIGGSSVFKANLSLFSRIPNISISNPLRLHTFVNIGDVFDFKSFDHFKDYASSGDLVKKSALATGFGLVYRDENATLDLSYNVPLNVRNNDVAKPGLGFAVSLRFA